MAIKDYLSPEQLQLMLNNTFGDEQNYVRPNPLQFKYPFIPGGITTQFDPRNFQSIFPTSGIRQQVPLQNLGIDTSYGVANEPDDEQDQEYINQVNQSNNKFGGIMDLLMGIAIPGYGLFKNIAQGGLEGLRGFNQRLQQSDFGQSDNFAEFLKIRRDREALARDPNIFQDAREITKSLASIPSSTSGGYQKGPGGSGAQTTSAKSKTSSPTNVGNPFGYR